MSLRYPLEIGPGAAADYIQFKPMKYRANNQTIADQQEGRGQGAGPPGAAGAQSVVLYMPNSTPVVGNENNWGPVNFQGPLGELKKLFATGAANVIDDQTDLNPQRTIENLI